MLSNDFNLEVFREEPVLGILRGVSEDVLLDVVSYAVEAGAQVHGNYVQYARRPCLN